jgi:chitin disaccharide deacetylase
VQVLAEVVIARGIAPARAKLLPRCPMSRPRPVPSGGWLILVLALTLPASGVDADAIRLIVMADDLGAAEAVNSATFAAQRDGVVTTSNIIVPGPWFPQAVRLAKEHPTFDIGIHLALTSEWSDVKWRPLTGGRSFCDEDGYFASFVWPNPKAAPARSLRELKVDLAEAEAELRAQIELARRHVPRVCYLWPHMAFTSHSPEMLALVRKLAKEYDIPLFGDVMDALGIKRLKSLYDRYDSGEQKAAALVKAIEGLTPGTWVLVDHAANDTPEMRAIGHVGYEQVALDRNAIRIMWLDPTVRAAVSKRGVVLIPTATVVAEWKARRP